jgi:hypothetical protein
MLSRARQLLKAALPRHSSSKAAAKEAAAAAAAAATGDAGHRQASGTQVLSQQQSFDDGKGSGFGDQEDRGMGAFAAKSPAPAAAAAAAGHQGVAAEDEYGFGAWDVADRALPIEAMSDTSFVTTRRRH